MTIRTPFDKCDCADLTAILDAAKKIWAGSRIERAEEIATTNRYFAFYIDDEMYFCCQREEFGHFINVLYYGYLMGKRED